MDVLVVDEAGQSTEAETCIAFQVCSGQCNTHDHDSCQHEGCTQYKPQKCLLVGDTRQLPATVMSRDAEKMYVMHTHVTRWEPSVMLDTSTSARSAVYLGRSLSVTH